LTLIAVMSILELTGQFQLYPPLADATSAKLAAILLLARRLDTVSPSAS
jgi:hypothetical protein